MTFKQTSTHSRSWFLCLGGGDCGGGSRRCRDGSGGGGGGGGSLRLIYENKVL